jgi:alpha-L-rhamnosidase
VPEKLLPDVVSKLADEVMTRGLTVGFLGVKYLFEALVKANRTDAAISCLLRTSFPSFGYEIYNIYEPSTSLWESWDGDTMSQWVDESSRSHHYQTSVNTFLRKYVVGLDMPTEASAWSVVKARPEAALLPPDLGSRLPGAAATLMSHRGVVSVSWSRIEDRCVLNVTVPTSSTGQIHVPKVLPAVRITESNQLVWTTTQGFLPSGAAGVVSAVEEERFVVFSTMSGQYTFVVASDVSS